MSTIANIVVNVLAGITLTAASVAVRRDDIELAIYGGEGPVEERVQPRELAGWPAPFLADRPGTSIIHSLGVEDSVRLWPLIASFAFGYLLVAAVIAASRSLPNRRGACWEGITSREKPDNSADEG